MSTHAERERLVEYLLGDLPEHERLAIEEQYFKDDDLYEALLAVENELAYDYAAGLLTPAERKRFEQRFLGTADQRARVDRARSVLPGVGPPRRRVTGLWWSVAAAAALVLAVGGWLVVDLAQRSDQRERAASAGPTVAAPDPGAAPRGDDPKASGAPPSARGPTAASPLVIAVSLQPGLVRGRDSGTRIVIPSQAGVVRLELGLPASGVEESSGSYRVAIRNADGAEIWSGADNLRVRPLVVDVPPAVLRTGDYELVLIGRNASTSDDLAEYYFSVVRR